MEPLLCIQICGFLLFLSFYLIFCHFDRLKYHVKFCTYFLFACCTAIQIIALFIVRRNSYKNIRRALTWSKTLSNVVGIEWVVSGGEHLDNDSPAIVISNHQTSWDLICQSELLPIMRKCSAVAKRSMMYVFPIGVAMWLTDVIFLDRNKTDECKQQLNVAAEYIKRNEKKMWIFAEGTRNKGRNLMPFRKGAFYAAVKSGLPIVPVVISPYSFIDDENKIFGCGKVYVTILAPVYATKDEDVDVFTKKVWNQMNTEFHRLTNMVTLS